MSQTRRFYVPEGRIVVLPVDLQPGPNATNMRHEPGAIVELEPSRCARFDRYLNGRLRAGDLVELADGEQPPAVEPLATPAKAPSNPKNPPAVTVTPKE